MTLLSNASRKLASSSLLLLSSVLVTHSSPFTPGNVLVSRAAGISEYSLSGTLVQTIPYPASPADHYARDLVVSGDGQLQFYDGTFNPYLCTYDPNAGSWSFRTQSGWSTVNQVSNGGIATYQNYVFVTDMGTFGKEERGIIRFDLVNGTSQRFGTDTQGFSDVTMGHNGLLYGHGVGNSTIYEYDPASLALLRTIVPNSPFGHLAVSATGDIFTEDAFLGTVSHFDPNGILMDTLNIGIPQSGFTLTDIDLSPTGQLLVASYKGGIYLTDETLDGFVTLPFGDSQFVAFTPIPEPQLLLPGAVAAGFLFRRKLRQARL
jgi:hypothetical protein